MERKITPQERYAKKFKKQYKIDCFTNTEQDIIEKLESVPNKAGYIKGLIRADISKKDIVSKTLNNFKNLTKQEILDTCYPIGSTFFTLTDSPNGQSLEVDTKKNPATILGGGIWEFDKTLYCWVRIK